MALVLIWFKGFMQTFLLTIHILAVLGLIGVVLLQRSEGGALGIGMSSFMTGRGQANLLTRTTMILAAVFFATSLALTILAGFGSAQRSLLQGITQGAGQGANQGAGTNRTDDTAPATPAPLPNGSGSLLDQLQKIEQQRGGASSNGNVASPVPAQSAPTPQAPATPPSSPSTDHEIPQTPSPY